MIKNSTIGDYYNCKFGSDDSRIYSIILNHPVYMSVVNDVMISRIILPSSIIKLINEEVTLLCVAKCDGDSNDIFEGYGFLGGDILVEDQRCIYGNYIETSRFVVLCTEDKNIFSKIKLLN